MFVPVPFVGGMEVPVVQVVDVVPMGNGDMSAIRTVDVLVT